MALSGIQIFKFLPKTNCAECGVPTCLAFAMALAAGKGELSQCPHVSADAKASLSEASAPPIRTIEVGSGAGALKTGGETVLFRHEKTFVNKTGLAMLVTGEMADAEVDERLARFAALRFDRVGLTLRPELVAVKTDDPAKMGSLAKKADAAGALVILMSENADALKAGAEALPGKKPLLYGATEANLDTVAAVAKAAGAPVVAKAGGDLDALAALSDKLAAKEIKDIVLDSGARDLKTQLQHQVAIRRAPLKAKVKSFGFPTIVPAFEMADDFLLETMVAGTLVAKYAGIVILSDLRGENVFPLLLERLNIYTDPQRPMVTEPKVYDINNPTDTSPVLVTSNFSLTYFIVSGEIEASRVPAKLLVVDTEGLSVLTAWAAGKFAGDAIGMAMKKIGLHGAHQNKKVVIPGAAAIISGDLEEELGAEWKVMIGPREAAYITPFLKQNFAA
jgi:acetyl-CoA decarbonylase/synthase complex subunit gamma